MAKTLWFEGAGCEGTQRNDVPNCRIRTAFVNDDGDWVYLEINAADVNRWNVKNASKFGWKMGEHWCYVDSAFYITEDPDIDDCNYSRIPIDVHSSRKTDWDAVRPYTMEGILRIVNEDCNASFDEVRVTTDSLAGYRVHGDNGEWHTRERYNRGDLFEYDEPIHQAMLAKRAELMEYHNRVFNTRYDNTSYWNASDGTCTSPVMNVRVFVAEQKCKTVYEDRSFTINFAV